MVGEGRQYTVQENLTKCTHLYVWEHCDWYLCCLGTRNEIPASWNRSHASVTLGRILLVPPNSRTFANSAPFHLPTALWKKCEFFPEMQPFQSWPRLVWGLLDHDVNSSNLKEHNSTSALVVRHGFVHPCGHPCPLNFWLYSCQRLLPPCLRLHPGARVGERFALT